MNLIKKAWSGIFGEGTNASKTSKKGLRGVMTFIASLLLANIDAISAIILNVIPDHWETITISGIGAGEITVQATIIFLLVGIANLMKRSPLTQNNKLVRAISG